MADIRSHKVASTRARTTAPRAGHSTTRRFLGEESGRRPRRLPTVTGCYETRPHDPSLDSHVAAQILCVAIVLAVLGCAHLWLQFSITDARMQYQRVQHQHRELLQRATLLEHEYERLCDIERLREYAVAKLKMIEPDAAQRVVATLPPDLPRKYQDEPATAKDAVLAHTGGDTRNRPTMEKLLLTITDANKAFAGRN